MGEEGNCWHSYIHAFYFINSSLYKHDDAELVLHQFLPVYVELDLHLQATIANSSSTDSSWWQPAQP